MNRRPKGQEPR